MTQAGRKHLRLAFTPSTTGREYFDDLVKRLTAESRLGVRVTQRQAFERMVYFARQGEAALKANKVA